MKPILKHLYQNSNNQEIKDLIFKSFDNDPRIREYAAYNPNTPVNILEKLSNDENDAIRIAIALNANSPIHVLEKLSNDIETRKYATNILTMKKKESRSK